MKMTDVSEYNPMYSQDKNKCHLKKIKICWYFRKNILNLPLT